MVAADRHDHGGPSPGRIAEDREPVAVRDRAGASRVGPASTLEVTEDGLERR